MQTDTQTEKNSKFYKIIFQVFHLTVLVEFGFLYYSAPEILNFLIFHLSNNSKTPKRANTRKRNKNRACVQDLVKIR